MNPEGCSRERREQIVREGSKEFEQGDRDAVLRRTADDAIYIVNGPNDPRIPWTGRRTGRAGLMEILEAISDKVEVERFEPRDFHFSDPDGVFVKGLARFRCRRNGCPIEFTYLQFFRFNADCQIVGIEIFHDFSGIIECCCRRCLSDFFDCILKRLGLRKCRCRGADTEPPVGSNGSF